MKIGPIWTPRTLKYQEYVKRYLNHHMYLDEARSLNETDPNQLLSYSHPFQTSMNGYNYGTARSVVNNKHSCQEYVQHIK